MQEEMTGKAIALYCQQKTEQKKTFLIEIIKLKVAIAYEQIDKEKDTQARNANGSDYTNEYNQKEDSQVAQ